MATPATIDLKNLPTVAIVGRVNVGKSTLFNRLIEEQKAIVSDIAGTTRTSNEGVILWRGKQARIIDTGGLTFQGDTLFEEDIMKQAERALERADLILFVVDGRVGVIRQEIELAKRLRQIKDRPVLLVANKVDHAGDEDNLTNPEWYRLGLGAPIAVSAASGRNVGDLLDTMYHLLQKSKRRPKAAPKTEENVINISLIGKPNVGKSSLFNKLIGEEKVIVSPIAHTTREPHDTLVLYQKQMINFIDTAGIRRKARVEGELEEQGVAKSIRAIESSDIILFVIDGSVALSSQDMQLGGLFEKRSKSVIILINKWDLSEDNTDKKRNETKAMVYKHFPHLAFAPLLFVSGLTGYRAHQIFPVIMGVWQARHTEITERALEVFMKQVLRVHRPSRGKGSRQPEIVGFRQLRANPPIFEMFIKYRTSIHMSYVHFIENKLREQFDFLGVPIVIKLSKMKR